jgi:hypothetical protein
VSKIQHKGDLEISENLDFQRRVWAFQRVGWVLMALVVLVALLGLLGPGLLSTSAKAENENANLSIREYERFLRFFKPTDLRLQLDPGATTDGEAHVWLDRQYVEGFQVQRVTPEPESVEVGPDRLTYVFNVDELEGPTAVAFNLQPQKFGRLQGQVGLEGEEPVSFGQFVYP